ncbi:Uncharacterised protein [Mycobacteroides abscessus subsp. abscessus]|nr:Uncharacterised protein [Mycobacteroides abscessus subsp. abscessus]
MLFEPVNSVVAQSALRREEDRLGAIARQELLQLLYGQIHFDRDRLMKTIGDKPGDARSCDQNRRGARAGLRGAELR